MEFNLKEYVMKKRSEGLNDKQIATSLGMSLKHLTAKLSGKKETEKKPVEILKPKKKKTEPVVEVKQPEPEAPKDIYPEEEVLKEWPKVQDSE